MRLTTIGIDFFQHDGVTVGTGWSEFDYAAADANARGSLRAHVGRFVKIHPDDVDELAEFGLALEGGVIVEAEAEADVDAVVPSEPVPVPSEPVIETKSKAKAKAK